MDGKPVKGKGTQATRGMRGTPGRTLRGTQEAVLPAGVEAARRGLIDEPAEKARYAAAALAQLLSSEDASGHAKAAAARTLAEMAGAIGRHQRAPSDRARNTAVSQLSRADLELELARLRTLCAGDST